MTDIERRLWYGFLAKLPVRWQRQKIIGSYIADFYCHKADLVVELDGEQHYFAEQAEYDKKRTAYFAELGIEVIRFYNKDAMRNFRGICEIIYNKMEEKIKAKEN